MLNKRKNVLKRTVAASLALLLASGAAPFLPGMELGTISAEAFCGRDTLSGRDLELYDLLKEKIIKIASGEETSSVINITFDDFKLTWSASELGVTSFNTDAGKQAINNNFTSYFNYDTASVVSALVADCPYELYWYDKTSGFRYGGNDCGYSYSSTSVTYNTKPQYTITMYVSSDYSSGNNTTVNRNRHGGIDSVTQNAMKIVNKYANKSDYDKLLGYAAEIIDLVEYNTAAASNNSTPYGDPWQLINVFDNDSTNKVVCEGYSKAFKYLCDLTDFDSSKVECYLVSGNLFDSSAANLGGHMWNVVYMDNGKTYLTDVTNSDNYKGASYYFLKGGSPYQASTYKFNDCYFMYSSDTENLYGTSRLTLDTADYSKRMEQTHTVSVSGSSSNCTITPSATSVKGGAKVTLTVSPKSGYELISLSAVNAKVRKTSSTSYYFFMPSTNTSVSAVTAKYAAAVPATCKTNGTKAHYEGSDGKLYIKQDGKFVQISQSDLTIASTGNHTYGEPEWHWNGAKSASVTIKCTACGTEKTANAAITSSSDNGISTYTAAATIDGITYVDSFKSTDYTITGMNLTVNGDISLNAYIKPSEEIDITGTYVSVTGPYNSSPVKVLLSDLPYLDDYGYIVSYSINAQDIDKNVTIRLFDADDNNIIMRGTLIENIYSDGFTKSIKDYIEAVGSGSYSDELIALSEAIDVYGTAAKAYFNSDAASPASVPDVYASELEAYKRTNSSGFDANSAGYYGHSLLLETKTTLRLYFKSGTDLSKITVNDPDSDEDVVIKKGTGSNGMGYIDISNIRAQNLSSMYKVTFEGGEYMCVSPLGYAYNVLSNYSNDTSRQKLCDLVKALYSYHLAAKAYFK